MLTFFWPILSVVFGINSKTDSTKMFSLCGSGNGRWSDEHNKGRKVSQYEYHVMHLFICSIQYCFSYLPAFPVCSSKTSSVSETGSVSEPDRSGSDGGGGHSDFRNNGGGNSDRSRSLNRSRNNGLLSHEGSSGNSNGGSNSQRGDSKPASSQSASTKMASKSGGDDSGKNNELEMTG